MAAIYERGELTYEWMNGAIDRVTMDGRGRTRSGDPEYISPKHRPDGQRVEFINYEGYGQNPREPFNGLTYFITCSHTRTLD